MVNPALVRAFLASLEAAPLYALTLHRPWPWAIFHAKANPKRVENRTWTPPPRATSGYLAIHAGKTFDREAVDFIDAIVGEAGRGAGWSDGQVVGARCPTRPDRHPTGIIGIVRVLGWVERKGLLPRALSMSAPEWAHQASASRWLVGPFGWVLTDVTALPQPIACKGAQGLWKVKGAELEQIKAWAAAA